MVTEKAVVVKCLTKRFGDVVALNNVSFEVDKGEFFTIIGPSGCGKTTLLRCIMGLETPNSGSIYLYDEDVKDVPTYKRDLSTIFQKFALFPHKTVEANIGFGLRMRGYDEDKIKSKVEETMKLVGLEGLGDRFPQQLSGGQQQRVALARSLAIEPRLLLFDEPLASIDFKLQQRMMVELKQIHQKLRLTSLYVTHSQEQAITLADRILVLNQGVIEQIGSPEELYAQPNSVFVAKFFGDIDMLMGEVTSVSKDTAKVKTDVGEFTADLKGRKLTSKRIAYATRPENMYIGPPAEERENKVESRFLAKIYKGSDVEYIVQLDNGAEFKVVKQGDQIVDLQAQPGDKVPLGWDRADVLLLEKPSAVEGISIERVLYGV